MRRLVLVAAILSAGCGATTGETVIHGTPGQSSAPTSAPVTKPTEPPAAKAVVGDTIKTTEGEAYTVMEYVDHFPSTNQFDNPPPGGFFAAIRVKACASPSKTLSVNPASYSLVEPDDSRIEESSSFVAGGKEPRLSYTSIQPSECVSGWINYGVTAKPKTVALSNSDLRWAVP